MSDVHLISRENWHRLIENVIEDAQPPKHMACDWLGDMPKPLIYPLIVYRQIERLKHGNPKRDSLRQGDMAEARSQNGDSVLLGEHNH